MQAMASAKHTRRVIAEPIQRIIALEPLAIEAMMMVGMMVIIVSNLVAIAKPTPRVIAKPTPRVIAALAMVQKLIHQVVVPVQPVLLLVGLMNLVRTDTITIVMPLGIYPMKTIGMKMMMNGSKLLDKKVNN